MPHEEITPALITGHVTAEVTGARETWTRAEAATYGAYDTVSLAGTEPAQRLLGRDLYRLRAVLIVAADAGGVYVGTVAQTQATTPRGAYLPGGTTLEIRNQQELWLVGDGTNAATVTVLNERFEES